MAAVDVDLMESVQVQVPGALLVVRSIYIAAIIIIFNIYSEVHSVPTARRPLIRLSVAFFPSVAFRLNPALPS